MWPKFALFALISFLAIAINLPDSMIARLGLETNYLFAALAAIVIAGLSVHRSMLLVILILACTVGANLPRGASEYLGLDRDILFATLIALVVVPFIAGKIDFR